MLVVRKVWESVASTYGRVLAEHVIEVEKALPGDIIVRAPEPPGEAPRAESRGDMALIEDAPPYGPGERGPGELSPEGVSPDEFVRLNWWDAVALVNMVEDEDLLRSWRNAELRDRSPRKSVLEALRTKGVT